MPDLPKVHDAATHDRGRTRGHAAGDFTTDLDPSDAGAMLEFRAASLALLATYDNIADARFEEAIQHDGGKTAATWKAVLRARRARAAAGLT